jgi:hypothetical protein
LPEPQYPDWIEFFAGVKDVMHSISTLTPADSAELDADREFVPAVLEACFPNQHLLGTVADLEVLQQVLDGGPYTDSPEGELVALGTALGDLLGEALDMKWVAFSDEHGRDLALRYGETSILIFPRDLIIKRAEQGEEEIEIKEIFEGVITAIRQLIDSGDYS